jgi:hypothetical protein
MYRNPKLLREARNHACQGCGADDGTIVAAHSNMQCHGKGMAQKAHDCFIAFLCFACHNIVDGRALPQMDKDSRIEIWIRAHRKTAELLNGLNKLDTMARHMLQSAGSLQ